MDAGWTAMVVGDVVRPELEAALREAGATVRHAQAAGEAIAALMEAPCDLAVVQQELPHESGLAVLSHLRADAGQTPVLLLSSRPDAVVDGLRRGADDVLVLPVNPLELAARALRRLRSHAALKAAQAEALALHALATTDGLTQVANHRHFQERLTSEFRRAQRYDDALALIVVDLDHFKAINDSFGHQVGDQVLVAVAGAVKAAVRETDFVARYGGEEFAVLMPQTHLAGALTVAERMVAELKALNVGPAGLKVTASFGVSGFPGRAVNSPEQLIHTADDAMYRAKREGRNKISLFQATMLAAVS